MLYISLISISSRLIFYQRNWTKNIISVFGCSFLIAAIILPTTTTNNVNVAFSQHSQHEVHEAQTTQVFDTVPVLLDGKVIHAKEYIHLYTSAPSKIATGHIQAHIPCDANGVSPLKVVGGMMIMPEEVKFFYKGFWGNNVFYHLLFH